MTPSLKDLEADARFDAIVIGGGINGAGIARELQAAGYATLLVERDDFGAGTTSRATRLIHGGLRYLEHGEIALVYESLAEREALVREAPHLVRPLRLTIPVYQGDPRQPWKVRAGLALYDALSLKKSLPRHRAVPLPALAREEPAINRRGLRAAYEYSDAQVEFPERLVIEAVRDFADAGGVALNHTEVLRPGIVSPGGTMRALRLRDACGAERELAARLVINATGPWADALIAGSDAERAQPLLGGTKGSHIVVDWPGAPRRAIFASARDGRPFFILPWYRYTLIGTTDLRYDGDPGAAEATPDEVRYLVEETRRIVPGAPLEMSQILYSYCGVRPLPYTPQGDEAAITRRHFLVDHAKLGGPVGLYSVVGGKLTTYRSLAKVVLAQVRKVAQPSHAESPTATHAGVAPAIDGPYRLYGRRGAEVAALAAREPALAAPICAHNPETLAQVAYAADAEFARTLADVLLRRLPCGWSACHALDGAGAAAAVLGERLGWDAARTKEEVHAYERELRRTLVPVTADAALPG